MSNQPALIRSKKHKALVCLQNNQPLAAKKLLDEACKLGKRDAEAWNLLGACHAMLEDFTEAERSFRHAAELLPRSADIYFNLGNAQKDAGKIDDAISSYEHAIRLKPEYPEALCNLAGLCGKNGDLEKAISLYSKATEIAPHFESAHYNLGLLYNDLRRFDQAIRCFHTVLLIDPASAGSYNGLGRSYIEIGDLNTAFSYLTKAREMQANFADVYNNIGEVLTSMGSINEASAHFKRAAEIEPTTHTYYNNYLLTLNYQAETSSEHIYTEHVKCATQLQRNDSRLSLHENVRNPDKRIRIAYLSPDFRCHSVSFFFEPIITHHNRNDFEVYCYSNVLQSDAVTDRTQSAADQWRDINHMDDQAVMKLIHSDGIDILIDLAGHTAHNRLPVFARKPAPVQVTYLGYPNTTGLKTMDYRLTDIDADPSGQDEFYTEKLVRLPTGFLCYAAPAGTPGIASLPSLGAGHVTFGSFNNLAKMTPDVIGLWVRILKAVPRSRLIIKNRSMKDGLTRERYLTLFRDAGIEEERLSLVAWLSDTSGHLGAYARVDIALDTFPYSGTATTCEALWMGVPVISLAGNRHAARVGVSLLTRVGLTELIAQSPEEYVKLAVELAGDTERLIRLRAGMRERVRNSPLCDAKTFTHTLEQAYREMWGKWCTS